MAEEEQLQQSETGILFPNTLITWERFHLPSLPTQFHSQSPIILLSDPHLPESQRSTPPPHKIDHPTSVVFPPINHEGLNLNHQFELQQTNNENAKPLLPISSEVKPVVCSGPVAVKRWLLGFKLPDIVSCAWKLFEIRLSSIRAFNFPLIGSLVVMLLCYLRFCRWRRRLRGEVVNELLNVIKVKDEKINNLLQQIARMNELLLAKHHAVPVISNAASS
ncbi:uncharacterized protein [Rutidosis leptorrhynchoides]|uniref:uncharacterized protein n=1 Tax=Rutidosis leptorrhynchoides TaxID=125765 RepID=UPI003A995C46